MVHLYNASKALYRDCALRSPHSHTDARRNHARHQPAHREQLGFQRLAQGHFDTKSEGAWVRTGNLAVSIRLLYPASPIQDNQVKFRSNEKKNKQTKLDLEHNTF